MRRTFIHIDDGKAATTVMKVPSFNEHFSATEFLLYVAEKA